MLQCIVNMVKIKVWTTNLNWIRLNMFKILVPHKKEWGVGYVFRKVLWGWDVQYSLCVCVFLSVGGGVHWRFRANSWSGQRRVSRPGVGLFDTEILRTTRNVCLFWSGFVLRMNLCFPRPPPINVLDHMRAWSKNPTQIFCSIRPPMTQSPLWFPGSRDLTWARHPDSIIVCI